LRRGLAGPGACKRIKAALVEGGKFRVLQIKEKFATFRFYWSGDMSDVARAKVEEAIALTVACSACTSEICGAQGRLYSRGGRLATACAEHPKGEAVPVGPGFENLHIVRRIVEGRVRILSCRRYEGVTDTLIDVTPAFLGIEG
jgi:hypothetical protein